MNLYEAILFIGPPGSGKGTQCQKLAADPAYFHFSTGEMLRSVDRTTNLGRTVQELIDNAQFVSDELITSLTQQTLAEYVGSGGFKPVHQYLLLDGIPRNVNQVESVKPFVTVKQIIQLVVPDDVCLSRMMHRAARGRLDDSSEAKIRGRLVHYRRATEPLLQHYDQRIIVRIDGTTEIENTYSKIKQKILQK